MSSIVHILKAGEECRDDFCVCEHYTPPPTSVVTYAGTTWVTQDGRVLDVSEMTPRHARNTWLFMHRNARMRAWREIEGWIGSPWAPRGEMASDAFDRTIDEMMEYPHAWLERQPLVRAMFDRGLDDMMDTPTSKGRA